MRNQVLVETHSYFKKLYMPFYTLMKWYVEADLKRYYCDITLGHDMAATELDEIATFRCEQYKEKQSYLIPNGYFEEMRERNLDLHAYHVVVRRKKSQEIVGVMRLGLFPFEVNALRLSKTLDLYPYERYLEISRLVIKDKGVGVGKRLLIHAGNWAINETSFDGFVAICREDKMAMFGKFGLKSAGTFQVEDRGEANYHFISANFNLISRETMNKFLPSFLKV